MRKIKLNIHRVDNFISKELWQINTEKLPKKKAFWVKTSRIICLTYNGYYKNSIPIRASALTFFSLLSIIPVIAMAFGVTKGFGLEKMLENQLNRSLKGQEEVINRILVFSRSLLESTKGEWIAGIGVTLLFYSIMKLLNNIETSFNEIWRIKVHRSFKRKLADYSSIMLFAPFIFVLSSSLNVYISSKITYAAENIRLLEAFTPFIFFLLKFIPYTLIWILLTLTYYMMPNTRIQIKSALLGGILAGTIFQVTQWTYIHFQIGVSRNNAIYGSFAAIPLLLIWLQLSWLIILIGAEISYAHQNIKNYEFMKESEKISLSLKKTLALLITHLVIRQFTEGKKPLTQAEISHNLKIPFRITSLILKDLVGSNILSIVNPDEQNKEAFQPAQDTDRLSSWYVINELELNGVTEIPTLKPEEAGKFNNLINKMNQAVKDSPSNKLLKEI